MKKLRHRELVQDHTRQRWDLNPGSSDSEVKDSNPAGIIKFAFQKATSGINDRAESQLVKQQKK